MSTETDAGFERFVSAQEPVWPQVLSELEAGAKHSHWMWFVFPQIAGLGSSAMSLRYAIASLAEARAYLAHPVLGPAAPRGHRPRCSGTPACRRRRS